MTGPVEHFIESTPLHESAAVKGFSHVMDNAIGALGAWLDGLTERVKESGKTDGISFKSDPHSMSRLADSARQEAPVARSKEVHMPEQTPVLSKEVTMRVASAGLKLPQAEAYHVDNHDLAAVAGSAKIVGIAQTQTQSQGIVV